MESVILAGGKCTEELRAETGCEFRSQIEVGGMQLGERVLRAMPEGPKFVVGPPLPGAEPVPSGATFIESLRNALDRVRGERFIVAAGDMPFVTAEDVTHFLSLCNQVAALNYPIIPSELCAKAYPGMKRTVLKTKEGAFTGGNLMLANAQLLRQIFPTIERAYAYRKSPMRLGALIGPSVLLRLALGFLTPWKPSVTYLEQAVGRMLGAKVAAVKVERPAIGADIDNLEQLRQAKNMVSSP